MSSSMLWTTRSNSSLGFIFIWFLAMMDSRSLFLYVTATKFILFSIWIFANTPNLRTSRFQKYHGSEENGTLEKSRSTPR